MKRLFDISVAVAGLIIFLPLLLVVAALIKFDSVGPVLFRQERIGKGFRPFDIYKFRTMVPDASRRGGPITFGLDPRITRVGRLLRSTKIDELPQLINVIIGDMSLVGPRPEVKQYVDLFRTDYEEILKVRPGITDLASLKYRSEAELLGQSDNPNAEYLVRVMPDKIKLAKEYIQRSSFIFDLKVIFRTVLQIFQCRSV
jgi:lipopolysaccharide/colanic/teichoic acid biosynthesis glycosyltransferase